MMCWVVLRAWEPRPNKVWAGPGDSPDPGLEAGGRQCGSPPRFINAQTTLLSMRTEKSADLYLF
jgi:hypothetical protein